MLNTVAIMGRIGHTPELKQTQSGGCVLSLRIACDRNIKGNDGKRGTDWIDVICFNKTAEFVQRYFNKGDLIAIEGRLQARDWQDKNGNKRHTVEIIANNVSFCGGKRDSEGSNSAYNNSLDAMPPEQGDDAPIAVDDNEDLPFN